MKTYGKEPESLDSIIDLFTETLAEFSWDEINAAMFQHAMKSAEFPTPADVITLIEQGRTERSRLENTVIYGVDDTIERLQFYRQKQEQRITLTPKEARLLREYGWRLDRATRP